MQKQLLTMLSQISAEEQRILGGGDVEMQAYGAGRQKIIDAHAMLGKEKQVDIRAHTRFAPFPRHKHDFVEIMYVCKGSVTHLVGAKEICVKEGELLFLGRNAWHEIKPCKKSDIAVNFIVRPSFFHTSFDMMDFPNVLSDFIINCLAGEGGANEYLHFAVVDVLPVQNLVENLIYTLCNEITDEKINEITMGLLFLHLLKAGNLANSDTSAPRALALAALQYIESNYTCATLRNFAAQNGVEEYTASRAIKAQLGENFRNLLMQKRFNMAIQLLQTTPLSVSEIIAAVGYENTSYFYRTFSQKYSCTPWEYRQKFSGNP